MNIKAIIEYCKKNKAIAVGVPIILGILLLDNLILKPRRNADKTPAQTTTAAGPAATATTAAAPAGKPAEEPIQPPPPLVSPAIPSIDPRVEARLGAQGVFPYGPTRNVFARQQADGVSVMAPPTEVERRSDIAYHGFFTIGMTKVAIIKAAGRLTLSRLDSKISDTPYILKEIHLNRIVLLDTENDNIPIPIDLTTDPHSGGKSVSDSISKLRAFGSTP